MLETVKIKKIILKRKLKKSRNETYLENDLYF